MINLATLLNCLEKLYQFFFLKKKRREKIFHELVNFYNGSSEIENLSLLYSEIGFLFKKNKIISNLHSKIHQSNFKYHHFRSKEDDLIKNLIIEIAKFLNYKDIEINQKLINKPELFVTYF